MIRAGRRAVTLADLARKKGVSLGTYKNAGHHRKSGHPAPISSPGSRPVLWDDAQTTAYYAGEPIPPLPAQDSPDDLLDRYEAAALAGVAVGTWDRYDSLPGMRPRPAPVDLSTLGMDDLGAEHWRRGDIQDWLAQRPGLGGGGRPKGTADLVPVDEIQPRAAALLARTPDLTAEAAADQIGVGAQAAQRALAAVRADVVAQLLAKHPDATPEQITQQTGFPRWAVTRALTAVAARRRAAAAEQYVTSVAADLEKAGTPVASTTVRVRPGPVVTAVLTTTGEPPLPPFLVWDERYGWRTAPTRPNLSRGEAEPPSGPGIRYLCRSELTPTGTQLHAQLLNSRAGTSRPPRTLRTPAQ